MKKKELLSIFSFRINAKCVKERIELLSFNIMSIFFICLSNFLLLSDSNFSGCYFSVHPDDSNLLNSFYEMIELDKAWEISKGSKDVSVGLIDSGINNVSSLDFSTNINQSLSCDLFDSEGNPFVDEAFHGTNVARRLAAKGNNGYDTAGVVWNLDLISLKVANNTNHNEDPQAFISSIQYATTNDIPILSFSGGFYYSSNQISFSQYISSMIALSQYQGLLVCAAGNENYDLDNCTLVPATFSNDNIIVVGASKTNCDEMNSGHSNYGIESVDLFAPAEWTSYAAPLISGTAAMLLSINPTLSASQIKNLIMDNVDYSEDLSELCVSGGRLNVYKAAKSAIPLINLGINYSLKPLKYNEPQWFCFVANNSGNYSFTTNGNCNTIGELYSNIQSAPVCSSSSGGFGDNFFMTYFIDSPGTYYLKIGSMSETISNNYTINVGVHNHSYTYYYQSLGPIKHRCYCQCGEYINGMHMFPMIGDMYGPCEYCGQPYGGLVPLENASRLCKESYITADGVLYLSENDYGDLFCL